eukprot:TRINITY_DN12748_c0_g1_i1.p1 TRINITY_DN12748_c0_g1~~TRINITY_DN12748_c0_g1_i1.p1  ORF type:complete len:539 (+),score=66.64 TRINITY_DN12748_c0_g1_i1:171-1787(+)
MFLLGQRLSGRRSLHLFWIALLILLLSPLPSEVGALKEEVFECGAGECDDVMVCPSGSHCIYNCDGYRSCTRMVVNCEDGSDCTFNCSNTLSCVALINHCYGGLCQKDCSAYGSCMGVNYHCHGPDAICIRNCTGYRSCRGDKDVLKLGAEPRTCDSNQCSEDCTGKCDPDNSVIAFLDPVGWAQGVNVGIIGVLAFRGIDVDNIILTPGRIQLLFLDPVSLPSIDDVFTQYLEDALAVFPWGEIEEDDLGPLILEGERTVSATLSPRLYERGMRSFDSDQQDYLPGVLVTTVIFDDLNSQMIVNYDVPSGNSTFDGSERDMDEIADLLTLLLRGALAGIGNYPREILERPEFAERVENLTETYVELVIPYPSGEGCDYPQPYKGFGCVGGEWVAPVDVEVELNEFLYSSSPVTYEGDVSFTSTSHFIQDTSVKQETGQTPSTIHVGGCASFSGELEVVVDGNTSRSIDLMEYSCHQGEFDNVIVKHSDSGCHSSAEVMYRESFLTLVMEIGSCSQSGGILISPVSVWLLFFLSIMLV